MDEIRKLLIQLIGIDEQEWCAFQKELVPGHYTAKSMIVRAGTVAHRLYFIERGLARTYYIQDGKEVNTYFSSDNQFISTFESFITQRASSEFLETIEDSQVYSLSYKALTGLYRENSKFEKLGRILAEENYLCVLDRTFAMQTKTAKEKYIYFLEKYDAKIVQRVPQHMIASFLGIAPESLSRIRRQLVTS